MSTSTPEWGTGILQSIHFILAIIANHILAILEFFPGQFFRQTWNSIRGQISIEVLATATTTENELISGNFVNVNLQNCTVDEAEAEDEADNDRDLGFASASSNSSDGEAEAEVSFGVQNEEINQPIRRYSSSSDDGISEEDKSAEITQRLISQVEQMFSDEALAKDGFLLKHVRRRSDGYVSLKLVAGLRKVKQISRDFPTILAALRLSLKLDVNLDGTKIRRMEPLTPYLKALPISSGGNKEKEQTKDEKTSRLNMKNNNQMSKKNSNSPGNSNPGSRSRNGSFSRQNPSPADVFYRNVHALSSGDESAPPVNRRRRDGSLPIPMNGNANANHYYYHHSRNSMYLSPNSSPPTNGAEMTQRPKSNSYCEGALNFPYSPSTSPNSSGMSAWLQQRRMTSARSSEGSVELNGVIRRQPRGPDGTRGFAPRNSTYTTVIED